MSYTYFRLTITALNGATDFTGTRELELYETEGGANALPAKTKTYDGSGFNSGFGYALAFDESYANNDGWVVAWGGTEEFIQVEVDTAIDPVEYGVGAYTTSSSTNARSMRDFKLEGSNDGVTWDLLDEQTGIEWSDHSATSGPKTFAISGPSDPEITAALTSLGGTVAVALEVEAQVAAALTTPGGTLAVDAAVIASVAAALTSGGGTVAAEVFTTEIRQFSAALTSAGGALSAETAVLIGVAASIEGAGGTLSANAQVLSEVAASLEGAPGTLAAELDTIPLSEISASLEGAPGTLAAELSRPPRLARLVVTLTDALQLNVTAKD